MMYDGHRDALLHVVADQRKRLFELEKRLELASGQKKVSVSRLSSARSSNDQRGTQRFHDDAKKNPYPESPSSFPVEPITNPDLSIDSGYPSSEADMSLTPPYPPPSAAPEDVHAPSVSQDAESHVGSRMGFGGRSNAQHPSPEQRSRNLDAALMKPTTSAAWSFQGHNSRPMRTADPAMSPAAAEPPHSSIASGTPRGLPSYRPPPYLHDYAVRTSSHGDKADSTTMPQQPIPRVERTQAHTVSTDAATPRVGPSTLRSAVPYNQPGLRLSYPQMSAMARHADVAGDSHTRTSVSPHTPPVPPLSEARGPRTTSGDADPHSGVVEPTNDGHESCVPSQKDAESTYPSQPSVRQRRPSHSEDAPRLATHVRSGAGRLSSHPPLQPCGPLPHPVRQEKPLSNACVYGDAHNPRRPTSPRARQVTSTGEAPARNDTPSPRDRVLLPEQQTKSIWKAPLTNDACSEAGRSDVVCTACGHKNTVAARPHSARGVLQGNGHSEGLRSLPLQGNSRPGGQQQSASSVSSRQQRPSSTGPQVTRRAEECWATPSGQKFGPNLTYIPGRSSLWSSDFDPPTMRGDFSAIGFRSEAPDAPRDPGVSRLRRPSGSEMLPPPLGRSGGDDVSRGSHFSSSSGPIRATFIPPTYARNGHLRQSLPNMESATRTTARSRPFAPVMHSTAPTLPATPEGSVHRGQTRPLSDCPMPDSAFRPDSAVTASGRSDCEARKASFAERAGHLRAQLAHVLQNGSQPLYAK